MAPSPVRRDSRTGKKEGVGADSLGPHGSGRKREGLGWAAVGSLSRARAEGTKWAWPNRGKRGKGWLGLSNFFHTNIFFLFQNSKT